MVCVFSKPLNMLLMLWICKCLNVPHQWAMPKNQRNTWKEVLTAMGVRFLSSHSPGPDSAVNICSGTELYPHALTNLPLKIKGDSQRCFYTYLALCGGT